MAISTISYSYKLRENSDLCQYQLASEKEFGVQCCLFRDSKSCKEFSSHYYNLYRTHYETGLTTAAFITVAPPNKAFEKFDQEKYKIVIPARAYFKLLDFFLTEWPLVVKRCECDYNDMMERREWITLTPSISFRGPADVIYRQTIDATTAVNLDLVVTKRGDSTGKITVSLVYTEEKLGSINLPPFPMLQMAQEIGYLNDLYEYKETIIPKRSRQM